MLRKSLIMKLFDGFSIRRWNDQIRPVELVEMDKTAHKMAVAWCLARYEEDAGHGVDWPGLVRGGVFELLRRVVLSDIKSPVQTRIRSRHPEVFRQLSDWVYRQLEPSLDGADLREDVRRYLVDDEGVDPHARRILDAAHLYATWWEFQILKRLNPESAQVRRIDRLLTQDLEPHLELAGMRKLLTRQRPAGSPGPEGVADFVDLVGHLRFQVRWGQTPRIPPTSVLGHSMMVACLSYFLAREVGACPRRLKNDFFGGLFHDLPESVTRDIISPVKGAVPDLPDAIGRLEQELAREEIYPLVEPHWIPELEYFTRDEFASKVRRDGAIQAVTSDEINATLNDDAFDPIDGELIRVADLLAAFVEAWKSIQMGIRTSQLDEGLRIPDRWRGRTVGGLDIGAIYADFQ